MVVISNYKTYLPVINDNNCIVTDYLQNNYIRVYDVTPYENSTIHYIDYFPNFSYAKREGYQSFGYYNPNVNCQSHANFTTDIFYNINLSSAFIVYFIIVFFIVYILKLLWTVFRKVLK